MKKMLGKITKFLIRKGPYIVLGALLFYVLTHTAFAAPDAAETKATTEQTLGFLLSIAMKMLNAFLWPFLLIIGELMDSDLIVGPGMEERLLGIWVQIRNFVNIGFVIMLLVIALYNAVGVGGGEGNLAMKTALPKLVLGLILVNFTFLGGKVLIDVSNVATTAVFALPEVVDDFDFANTTAEFSDKICKKQNSDAKWLEVDTDLPISTKLFCELKDGEYTGNLNELMQATYFKQLNANNVGIVMAVNMGALESLALLKEDAINDISDLIINGLFSVIMYVLFAASYITLGLVLLARIVVLWVALALSPVIVLFYVVPQIKEAAGANLDIMEKVTKHLLAPIIIGVVLTIGFLMISAMAGLGDSFQDFAKSESGEIMTTDFLISGVEDMEKFIIAIATVMVIWTGVFAAAEGTYASFATNYIKGLGEKVGTALAKAPLYATTIPVPGSATGETTSPMAALGVLDKTLDALNYGGFSQEGSETLGRAIFPEKMADRIFGGGNISTNPKENERSMRNALEGGNISTGDLQGIADKFKSDINRSSISGKTGIESDIAQLREQLASGDSRTRDTAKEKLAELIKEHGEGVGYEDSEYLRGRLRAVRIVETPAATPPPPGEPEPEPEPEPPAAPAPISVGGINVTFPAGQAPTEAALTALRGITDLSAVADAEIDAITALTEAQGAIVKAAKAAAATPPAPPAGPPAG